jgi:hypothetical protein
MNNNRRTTIHDLTTLSLHQTGARVQPNQTDALKDVRGNWIARDAGGWGAVPKRRLVAGESDEEESEAGKDTRKGKARQHHKEQNLKDPRARKRRQLTHDVDFLHDPILNLVHSHPVEDDDGSSLKLSIPSSVRPHFSHFSSSFLLSIHTFLSIQCAHIYNLIYHILYRTHAINRTF